MTGLWGKMGKEDLIRQQARKEYTKFEWSLKLKVALLILIIYGAIIGWYYGIFWVLIQGGS